VHVNTTAESVQDAARTASVASEFTEKTAKTAADTTSATGRVLAAVSSVRLGARLLPAAIRLFRRYPLASSLVVGGVLWIAYSNLSKRRQYVER
jgi:hypothetical protein